MKGNIIFRGLFLSSLLFGCKTYQYAQDVKLVSFDDDFSKGKSVGPVEGKDCQTIILGYPTGPVPTLSRALANARTQHDDNAAEAAFGGQKSTFNGEALRYLNNVSTSWDGFNAAGVYAQRCLVVKGVGYR